MPEQFYQNKLFPFQDEILHVMQRVESPFYLTGGTALSRCYLHHRYSDDLDFFVNADPDFKRHCDTVIAALTDNPGCEMELGAVADSFLRLTLKKDEVILKVELVNDVKFHWGGLQECAIYYRVDNWRNILSNKLCSLSRREVKDLVDVIFISKSYAFNWEDIFGDARQKDLWVEPLEICKMIDECPLELFDRIKWVSPVGTKELGDYMKTLRDDIFWGRDNSLLTAPSKDQTHNP